MLTRTDFEFFEELPLGSNLRDRLFELYKTREEFLKAYLKYPNHLRSIGMSNNQFQQLVEHVNQFLIVNQEILDTMDFKRWVVTLPLTPGELKEMEERASQILSFIELICSGELRDEPYVRKVTDKVKTHLNLNENTASLLVELYDGWISISQARSLLYQELKKLSDRIAEGRIESQKKIEP